MSVFARFRRTDSFRHASLILEASEVQMIALRDIFRPAAHAAPMLGTNRPASGRSLSSISMNPRAAPCVGDQNGVDASADRLALLDHVEPVDLLREGPQDLLDHLVVQRGHRKVIATDFLQ